MADDIRKLTHTTSDIDETIDEVGGARGEYDSLGERLDDIGGESAEDRAALVELVDGGAKNLAPNTATSGTASNVVFTVNSDGTVIANGTASTAAWFEITGSITLPAGAYVISGGEVVDSVVNVRVVLATNTSSSDIIADSNGEATTFTLDSSTTANVYIRMSTGRTANNVVVKPMLCTKAAWDTSQTYQPYRKNLAELTVDSDEDRAALVEIVDNGAKNILDLTKATEVVRADELSYTLAADGTLTVTWTADLSNSGKTINFKGFPYKAGIYILSGAQLDGSSTAVRADVRQGSTAVVMDYGQPPTPFELPSEGYNYVIRVQAPAGSATFKPMICTEAAWNISHAYQPPRPSYQELYERVVALEQAQQ
ncbi:MAG: hypothetical protein IJM44_01545 [Ruminococcus sp.]|nr:hypothetical protein [Ruminococcus sp.]